MTLPCAHGDRDATVCPPCLTARGQLLHDQILQLRRALAECCDVFNGLYLGLVSLETDVRRFLKLDEPPGH